MFESVKFVNGADQKTAEKILKMIKKDINYREREILENLALVENNKNVPIGYIQYVFYDKKGNGFQAGKDMYGKWGITL